jgi:hypothetical protein
MASLGQKALKRAFQKSGGNWDLACEILMAEADQREWDHARSLSVLRPPRGRFSL